MLCGEYWIDGTFSEVFELDHFPLDCQDLTVRMALQQYTAICSLGTPFRGEDVLTVSGEYAAISEWKMHAPKLEMVTKRTGPVVEHSMINLSLKLERASRAYFGRLALFLVLLTSMSLVSLSIDAVESGPDRMTFLVTLLLTAIAFQFVIEPDLPKLGYLTLMDKYILQTLLFIFGVIIETAVAMRYELETLDAVCHYSFWAIFVCLQIGFLVLAMRARVYESRKLEQSPADIDKYGHKKRRVSKLIKLHKFGSRKLL